MKFTYTLSLLVLCLTSCLTLTHAANVNIINQCSYPVWAAASPGGGRRLDKGQSWPLDVAPGTANARIWGRTSCKFDANGQGQCQTGDCSGRLECQGYGKPPNTVAEFALNRLNNQDVIDIKLVEGFNIPLGISSVTSSCRDIRCSAPIVDQCPTQLRTRGGCNNPCTVFKTNKYCCANGPQNCGPTNFSKFFKDRCPDASSYPGDAASFVTCPSGTNYRVVFCP
ncbi:unnamed protein product [Coffea canephora]|uniref:Thaumatin-like protein n=2 Tax=Coffea TaxID=13442 RepID=A0A068V677_COFCA|nr:thaumatin-like protein [Coffea arabica]CDP16245.1 unnamed protein product [Coffea canephora]